MNLEENRVKIKKKIKLKSSFKISLYCVLATILVFSSFTFLKYGKKIVFVETEKINYSLNGDVDYEVELKENDYYKDTHLKSGMQYIAELINSVNIKFKYEGHATDKIDYAYRYNVSATTIVTSKTDKSKVLFENKEFIVKDKEKKVNDKSFVINEDIIINYDKYNDYILNYKKEYALNTLFDLIINVQVETKGKSKISDEIFDETKDFQIVIPLSEQMIDITLNGQTYDISGVFSGEENKTIQSRAYCALAIIQAIIASILYVKAMSIVSKINKNKNIYQKTIEKYLREYDRAIVITQKTEIDESNFESVIEISSMQEMIDLHDNFQLPILYYEIVKNEISYFVIIKENILYKFVVQKNILEENSGDKK